MLESKDSLHSDSVVRNRTSSMDFTGHSPVSKKGRSGSISGRLRAASDLEEIGWIDKSQKGLIKDLIISGDSTLRSALDKYENGDAHDLEVLIQRGMLARKQSLDLLDGLDMDFLTVGYGEGLTTNGGSFSDKDFFLDQNFDDRKESFSLSIGPDGGSSDLENDLDAFRTRRCSSISLLGDGSIDLIGSNFFDGLGSYILPPSSSGRKHSLSLPPGIGTPRSGFIAGMGGGGDVDLSAYRSMAVSLQAQSAAQAQNQRNAYIRGSSFTKKIQDSALPKTVSPSPEMHYIKSEKSSYPPFPLPPARTVSTTSSLPTPDMQNKMIGLSHAKGPQPPKQYTVGSQRAVPVPVTAQSIDNQQRQQQQQQQSERGRETMSQQQQLLQNHRQQQLAEMQHSLMLRQLQLNGARQQQQQQHPIMSHPHGHIHSSHSHAHYPPQLQLHLTMGQGQGLRAGSKALSLPTQRMFPLPEEGRGGAGSFAGLDGCYTTLHVNNKNNYNSRIGASSSSSHLASSSTELDSSLSGNKAAIAGFTFFDPSSTNSAPPTAKGFVGAYSPEARRARIERFLAKRDKRVWTKKVKYDVRKNFADSRLRVKGRFVKKEDEELMKELLSI